MAAQLRGTSPLRLVFMMLALHCDVRLKRLVGSDLSLSTYGAEIPSDIDLLFVDTVHEYEHVAAELALYLPLMAPGGIIVMDDISISLGMKRFWDGSLAPLERVRDSESRWSWVSPLNRDSGGASISRTTP